MPSVGMRRTTRVFGARVLRSGRRLWSGPFEEEVKHMRPRPNRNNDGTDDNNDYIDLLDNNNNNSVVADIQIQGQCKENGWHNDVVDSNNPDSADEMDIGEEEEQQTQHLKLGKVGKAQQMGLVDDHIVEDRRWGSVYSRKRKRKDSKTPEFVLNSTDKKCSDRRYGKKFVRKQARKKIRDGKMVVPAGTCDLKLGFLGEIVSRGITGCLEPSCCSRSLRFPGFLNSVLRYMRRNRVKLSQLCSFLLSEPITRVFSSHGIRFLQDSKCIKSSGFCKIFGVMDSIPLFAMDFSAVPFSFMYLHSSLLLKSDFLYYSMVEMYLTGTKLRDDTSIDDEEEEQPSSIPCEMESSLVEMDQSLSELPAARNANSGEKKVGTVSVPTVSAGRSLPLRNGVSTRGIQKRRTTALRSRRRKNLSAFVTRKRNGALVSDLISKQDGVPFFPIKSNPELARSIRRISAANTKELKSNLVGLTQDIDSVTCNANILVTEPDRCYREEGAVIAMESSDSQEWFLVVKRNGIKRFSLMAQNGMRPCCCNRITNAIIWASDGGWRLEFPNRQDWFIFKELYRKCSERNVEAPVEPIPVPGVREVQGFTEVSGYGGEETLTFRLPAFYISSKGDEVSRALEKNNLLYDMDCEDEEWLNKFNEESCIENEPDKRVSEDTFERIIDAFERGFYRSPDDYCDVKSAVEPCLRLASREALEAVYNYWMAKRKMKRSALVRMFQCYQPRRGQQLTFKAVMRKKRSYKRQASQNQVGRGKQLPFLKAISTEKIAEETHNASIKVQESEAAAKRSEEAAVVIRQRAQLLMEIADMATYKATMALRIAEAAESVEEDKSSSSTAHFFLGE